MPFRNNKRRNILIRLEEEEAAYVSKSNKTISIIKQILKQHGNENIVILGRYETTNFKDLQKIVGKKVKSCKNVI